MNPISQAIDLLQGDDVPYGMLYSDREICTETLIKMAINYIYKHRNYSKYILIG